MATTREIGKKLCELCAAGRWDEAMEALYAEEVLQVEAAAMPGCPREMAGKDAIRQMTKQWQAHTTIHGQKVQGPYFHGDDKFACTMWLDCTSTEGPMKGRHQIEEVCVYTVQGGKIVRAEFFYDMGG
jgi:ketosteroid isomerase-like protein